MDGYQYISYAKADGTAFALRLHEALALRGLPSWLDVRELGRGRSKHDIDQAIRNCDNVLFVVSPGSIEQRSECERELALATELGKRIIPLLAHRNAHVSPGLGGNGRCIDFTEDFDSATAELCDRLGGASR